VSLTNPAVNSLTQIPIDGLTGTAGDVVISPPAGSGVTIDSTVATLSDFRVAGATNGVVATGVANAMTLSNVEVQGSSANGLLLTGTWAATGRWTSSRVRTAPAAVG
jgi:hypothetical protein